LKHIVNGFLDAAFTEEVAFLIFCLED